MATGQEDHIANQIFVPVSQICFRSRPRLSLRSRSPPRRPSTFALPSSWLRNHLRRLWKRNSADFLSTWQIFGMAEKEMEYRVELFNKLCQTCFNKCVEKRYAPSFPSHTPFSAPTTPPNNRHTHHIPAETQRLLPLISSIVVYLQHTPTAPSFSRPSSNKPPIRRPPNPLPAVSDPSPTSISDRRPWGLFHNSRPSALGLPSLLPALPFVGPPPISPPNPDQSRSGLFQPRSAISSPIP
ncbi:Mitochondrial import inner membrane translocase subunit TIM10 [Platanthera zijinensis]|uniref:Mitochondrial import inner membrane translocase subunit TIM10 n=1 Tax=Platanthera zijinensis TaxID=2320716 RepID=A0AAP0G3J1_9ASPA